MRSAALHRPRSSGRAPIVPRSEELSKRISAVSHLLRFTSSPPINRAVEQRGKLVWLITRRSEVRLLPALPASRPTPANPLPERAALDSVRVLGASTRGGMPRDFIRSLMAKKFCAMHNLKRIETGSQELSA